MAWKNSNTTLPFRVLHRIFNRANMSKNLWAIKVTYDWAFCCLLFKTSSSVVCIFLASTSRIGDSHMIVGCNRKSAITSASIRKSGPYLSSSKVRWRFSPWLENSIFEKWQCRLFRASVPSFCSTFSDIARKSSTFLRVPWCRAWRCPPVSYTHLTLPTILLV